MGRVESERILILAPRGRDGPLARQVLEQHGFSGTVLPAMADVAAALDEGAGALLVAEEALDAQSLEQMRAMLDRRPEWSDVPVLILSVPQRMGYRSLRPEILATLGNVTVLDRPVRIRMLTTALNSALRARRRQYAAARAILQREQFLAVLGHELRNPLSAISLSVSVLHRTPLDPVQRRAVEGTERQVRRLTRLVDDLVDASRFTTGRIELQPRIVDLGALASRVVAEGWDAGSLPVALTVQADVAPVRGDEVRLEQVVSNLVSNAIRYTPAGGKVRVRVARVGEEVELTVEDTGIGIPPDDLEQVFALFSRTSAATRRTDEGLGIGLTLVRAIVELHGGTVRARSEGTGRGSTFVVRLPAAADALGEGEGSAAPVGGGRRRRVLLVDDETDAREPLRDLLVAHGHEVFEAADGPSGAEAAIVHRPEIAILDLGLPGFDGHELARRIRDALGDQVFLVALTGFGLPDDRARALQGAFDEHLTKPAPLDALLAVLQGGASANETPEPKE